jgi:hypothetical protein
MANHNSAIVTKIILVSIFVDGMDDMGGLRRWKSMGHHVVRHVSNTDFHDFNAMLNKFKFEVPHILGFVGLMLKDDT